MRGLMQEHPLLIPSLLEHAVASHPDAEIVSRTKRTCCWLRRRIQTARAIQKKRRPTKTAANKMRTVGIMIATQFGNIALN